MINQVVGSGVGRWAGLSQLAHLTHQLVISWDNVEMDLQATVEKRMHVVCLPLVLDELSEDLKELSNLFSNRSDNVCV